MSTFDQQSMMEFIEEHKDELHFLTEHYPNQLAYKIKLFLFQKQLEANNEVR